MKSDLKFALRKKETKKYDQQRAEFIVIVLRFRILCKFHLFSANIKFPKLLTTIPKSQVDPPIPKKISK